MSVIVDIVYKYSFIIEYSKPFWKTPILKNCMMWVVQNVGLSTPSVRVCTTFLQGIPLSTANPDLELSLLWHCSMYHIVFSTNFIMADSRFCG